MMKPTILTAVLVAGFLLLISSGEPQETRNEKYRPQYHFSPEKNFLGNPAGFVYQNGEYHLFYQYNPSGKGPENLHLGHVLSKDLLRWEFLPEAIAPSGNPGDTLCNSVISGSVVVDQENILGYQQGNNKTLVLFYTENRCGQHMAYSTDLGKSWKKNERKPLIALESGTEALQPQVFWHAASRKWVMAIYTIPEKDSRKKGFSFYHSKNLIDWEFGSHLAGFSENPALVELKVNNRPDETRWVVMEGNGNYIIGLFNGTTFVPESIRLKSDFGEHFSCPENLVNLPAEDGRIIQMATLTQGEWPEMPFSGQFTFPVELSLRKVGTGIFLTRQPVREIEKLYGKQVEWKNENLIPGINKNLIKKIEGKCFRIKGRFDLKNCDSFGFMLRAGKKSPGTELLYNVKRQTLSLMGHSIGLAPLDNKISLDILMDRASAEVYANGGIASISSLIFPGETDNEFILYNNGGELLVEELTITEINSPWAPEEKQPGKKK